MSKLIYALSKAGLEIAYGPQHPTAPKAMTDPTNVIYQSVAFTEDGYLYTHGKYFRIFDSSNPFDVTYSQAANVANGNIVALKDAAGNELTNFDIGIYNITGTAPISVSITNGVATITHDNSSLAASTLGATAASADSIVVPKIVTNATGHLITGTTQFTATLNQVKSTAVTAAGDQYLVFALAGTTGTSELNKATALKYNPGTGALTAGTFVGNLTNKFSLTLNGGAAIEFNNSAAVSTSFYAPTGAGTQYQILQANASGIPSWITLSAVGSGSTYNEVPSAAAVYSAIQAGIGANDAMVFKGFIDASTNPNYPAADKGHTYKISVAGHIGGASGPKVEIGDTLICSADGVVTGTHAVVGANWGIIQNNIEMGTAGVSIAQLGSPTALSFLNVNTSGVASFRTAAETKTDLSLNNVENTALSTWVGTANITTLGTIGTGTWNATAISVAKGGTGLTSYTTGDLIYASGATTLAKLADVAVGSVLKSGGVGVAPSWGTLSGTDVAGAALSKVDDTNVTLALTGNPLTALLRAATITVGWTGTLAGARGGTGQSTYAKGDILYAPAAGSALSKLAVGADGTILKLSGGLPTWGTDNDTHYTATMVVGATNSATTDAATATNGNVYLNLVENGSIRNTHNIIGAGSTTVTATSGAITISSVNTWRNILAYTVASPTAALTIGSADLQFGDEFFWSATELKLGWAEVSGTGVVTYAY